MRPVSFSLSTCLEVLACNTAMNSVVVMRRTGYFPHGVKTIMRWWRKQERGRKGATTDTKQWPARLLKRPGPGNTAVILR